MKAKFESIKFIKPVETQKGLRYQFSVDYTDDQGNAKTGTFLSEEEDQKIFKDGEENEFTEYKKNWNGKVYYNIYPPKGTGGGSNFSRKMKQEQAKYSGFAMAYAKDLRVAGKIGDKFEMFKEADEMFDWMVRKDKELQHGK